MVYVHCCLCAGVWIYAYEFIQEILSFCACVFYTLYIYTFYTHPRVYKPLGPSALVTNCAASVVRCEEAVLLCSDSFHD